MNSLLSNYQKRMQYIFDHHFHACQDDFAQILSVIPAMKNINVLLTGTYGTGKTTFVEALAKYFFAEKNKPSIARVRCHQELTDLDVLYAIKFSDLDAPVTPRAILNKHIRYFNEIPRSKPSLQNALLSLFSEQQISFRDQHFDATNGINICDQNPDDMGQDGIVSALLDRFDIQIILPDSPNPILQEPIDSLKPMSNNEMKEIWQQVSEIEISEEVKDYGLMLNRYFSACVVPRSIITGHFELPCIDCAYTGEICQSLRSVPGMRGRLAMFHLGKAIAWFNGRSSVTTTDFEIALPYCYAHRLELHTDISSKEFNPQTYLQSTYIEGHLQAKQQHWLDAIKAKQQGDTDSILKIASKTDDLVIAWLYDITKKQQQPMRQTG